MRRAAAMLLAGGLLVLLVPQPAAARGVPWSNPGCYGTDTGDLIAAEFADTPDADAMQHIAYRESGCDPCAHYPSRHDCPADDLTPWPRTAKGVFQLLGHDQQIRDACPLLPQAWAYPECVVTAARWLYDGRGLAPWSA